MATTTVTRETLRTMLAHLETMETDTWRLISELGDDARRPEEATPAGRAAYALIALIPALQTQVLAVANALEAHRATGDAPREG